jgi:hypothetical protein
MFILGMALPRFGGQVSSRIPASTFGVHRCEFNPKTPVSFAGTRYPASQNEQAAVN